MKSILQMYKIGLGPNSLMNVAPFRACDAIVHDIKANGAPVDRVEICLYHEFARLEPQVKTSESILKAFEDSGIKVSVHTDRKAPPAARHPLTFDAFMFDKDGEMLGRHRIVSTGGGNFLMTDRLPHPSVYFFGSFEDMRKYFLKNKDKSFFDVVCMAEKKEEVIERFEECIKLMDETIENGLKKTGLLEAEGVHYERRAKAILENKPAGENDDQEMIRLISAYAYAIGEEAAAKAKVAITPSVGTASILWAALRYIREKMHPSKEQIYNALSIAGLICSLIEQNASISANDAGCQAEMSTGCGMAAVALASIMYNADIEECGRAWEMAIEHALGIFCGSVCAVPLVPCVQRSAAFAVRAYEIAVLNHSLMPTEELCKLDDVILVMLETGADLMLKNRQPGDGGFADVAKYSVAEEKK